MAEAISPKAKFGRFENERRRGRMKRIWEGEQQRARKPQGAESDYVASGLACFYNLIFAGMAELADA